MSTQAENGSFDASVAVRAVRGKLRGSWAERRWWRLHVPALHRGSEPVAGALQATMAWKRSGHFFCWQASRTAHVFLVCAPGVVVLSFSAQERRV